MRYKDNEKLLDNKGEWIYHRDEEVNKLKGKVIVGFLQDSHCNVIGFAGKNMIGSVGIPGYSCSHFRMLSKEEIEAYCNPSVEKEALDDEAEDRELLIDPSTLDVNTEGIEDAISDAISDITGFCHHGFSWSIQVNTKLDIQ